MNSSSEDYRTFEELDDFFTKKISLLNEGLELQCMSDQASIFFRSFESSVIELRKIFSQIKSEIKDGQNQLAEMKDLLKKMEAMNNRVDHMQKNFPDVLKQPKPAAPKREKTDVASTPVVTKKVKMPAKINYLTLSEFESVPKYMKGRLQYAQINAFIDTFNKVITAKYKLLSLPRKQMKPADYKICNMMKLEENEATKGCYFCTTENLKDYGNMKIDKSMNNFVTILRHCNRLKEVRGPGPLIRYVVVA